MIISVIMRLVVVKKRKNYFDMWSCYCLALYWAWKDNDSSNFLTLLCLLCFSMTRFWLLSIKMTHSFLLWDAVKCTKRSDYFNFKLLGCLKIACAIPVAPKKRKTPSFLLSYAIVSNFLFLLIWKEVTWIQTLILLEEQAVFEFFHPTQVGKATPAPRRSP